LSRRQLLTAAAASAAVAAPQGANASYTLYAASQESFDTRKRENWVPVATSDTQTLAMIQAELDEKRPQRKVIRATKKQVFCAGKTSAVSPLMENVCLPENTGASKADLTTGRSIGDWEGAKGVPYFARYD
jgi:hypothetical protein